MAVRHVVVRRHTRPLCDAAMQSFRLGHVRSRARPAPHSSFAGADDADEPLAVPQEHAPPSAETCAASRALQDAGNAHAEEGRFAAALREWEKALKLTPRQAALHESMVSLRARISAAASANSTFALAPGASIPRNWRVVARGCSRRTCVRERGAARRVACELTRLTRTGRRDHSGCQLGRGAIERCATLCAGADTSAP